MKKSLNDIDSQIHNHTWQAAKRVTVIRGSNDCTAEKVLSREFRYRAINLAPIPIKPSVFELHNVTNSSLNFRFGTNVLILQQ